MQNISDQIAEILRQSPITTYQIVATIAAIFVIWLIRFIAMRIVYRNVKDPALQYKWRKNLTYITVFIGFLIVGNIWFEGLQSVATFLGLLTAGLAIALRDPVTDLAGWLFVIWRKPFDVGDRIQVGDVKGDVVDVRIFKFTLLEIGNWVHADQSTGRVIHVPNHKIFTESLANYTSGFEFIWNEIEVLITFESDWEKGKRVLQEISEKHLVDFIDQAKQQISKAQKSYLIHYNYLTPIVYTDVRDSGVCLIIRHLTNPRKRRGVSQSIWEDILKTFHDDDELELAYPTMRIYKPEDPKLK